jgi:hypothetical protein
VHVRFHLWSENWFLVCKQYLTHITWLVAPQRVKVHKQTHSVPELLKFYGWGSEKKVQRLFKDMLKNEISESTVDAWRVKQPAFGSH